MITFKTLTATDIPLLYIWLNRPHVAEWWESTGTYSDIENEFVPLTHLTSSKRGYLALLDHQPFGFIQVYTVKDSGDGWWEEETDAGARGIDQFIGEPAYLNRGVGTAMVQAFTEFIFQDPSVTKIQTDPNPTNTQAIRCYTKAGFKPIGRVLTPDGPALLMVKQRSQ